MTSSNLNIPKPPLFVKLFNLTFGSLFVILAILISPPVYTPESDWIITSFFGGIGLVVVAGTLWAWRA
jgi:hypothetical protein